MEHVLVGVDAADEIRLAWRRIAGDGNDDIVDEILARHGEPHRHYHTAEHVMWVLRHVDDLVDDLRQRDPTADERAERVDVGAITAAALFHDVVYDPRSAVNESDSAALADRRLESVGWSLARREEVASLILSTEAHVASSRAAAVLNDADLAVLGASPADYQRYSAAVRAEYAHVEDEAWRSGRTAVLRTFLDRPRIFATATMSGRREQQARTNIRVEIDTLLG